MVSHYNAHETTAVEPFAVALLCGDVRADVSFFSISLPFLAPLFGLDTCTDSCRCTRVCSC